MDQVTSVRDYQKRAITKTFIPNSRCKFLTELGVGKISVRPFAWHDLITFYRYRNQVVCTDSAQALTRGSPIGPRAFLARLNPAVGVCTCVYPAEDNMPPLIGQMQYTAGDRSAHIVYFMPGDDLNQPSLAEMLDTMASQAGSWGAFHLLAEAEENSCIMEGLRRSGLSVYAWQRIWKYSPPKSESMDGKKAPPKGNHEAALWQPANSIDEVMIRNLYQSLVPPLVQSAEPLTSQRLLGWVYRQEGEILAYVEGIYGPNGIYFQPLIHPALENISQVLSGLFDLQKNSSGRPIYVAIRSYQAWLETILRDLECEVTPRQALMVKHLVAQQRSMLPIARHSVLEKYTTEPTVPMVHNATNTTKP